MKIRKYMSKLSSGTVFQILRRGFHSGFCPVCERRTLFFKRGDWWRDHYHCIRCFSIPRQRALFSVLHDFFPDWRELSIHEASPKGPTFDKFSSECPNYVPTQFYPGISPGSVHRGFRCEDLAQQTFDDGSFDIVITQDVLEHLLDPVRSLRETCRTLKQGGAHVFTVPWYYWQETKIRVRKINDDIEYLEEPEYHKNSVDDKGSIVVTEWGRDLIDTIYAISGMSTTAIHIQDRRTGVVAKFIEVFISRKTSPGTGRFINHWYRT